MSVFLDLSSPIDAHGQTVTRLEFRAPTGADMMACGVPVRTETNGTGNVDAPVIGALISRLAAIPPSSVATMSGSDFMDAMGIVMGFLVAGPPTSSTSTSMSATSSAA